MRPFPFVVGCGRSGTTLLRAMLTSHPDLAIPAESYFVLSMRAQRRRYEHSHGFRTDLFLADLAKHHWFRQWDLALQDVSAHLNKIPKPSDIAEAFRRVYSAYAEAQGKSYYGDKTPVYVLHLVKLGGLLPEARFIHLIRDARDVAASLVEVHFGPNAMIDAALYWQRHVEAGRSAGATLGGDRYLEVRYEDMVARPSKTLSRICEFIEIPFHDSMLDHQSNAFKILAPLQRPLHVSGVMRATTVGVRDWRRDLRDPEIAMVEAVAGPLLADLGYETVSTGFADELVAQARKAKAAALLRASLRRRLNGPLRFYRRAFRPWVRVAASYLLTRRDRWQG